MGLSYYFTFSAPATVPIGDLIRFVKSVEADAKKIGFDPTLVLDAPFDTQERREFARRVVPSLDIEDEKLKGAELEDETHVWDFSPQRGRCRLAPERAVILVVTDEGGCETVFGFARYPETLRNINGESLVKTPVGNRWFFRDFVDSPDPRYRRIVKCFAEAGYLEDEKDEFAAES